MFNKFYEWIGTGIASLRNGAPANEIPGTAGVSEDSPLRRKRPNDCMEDGGADEENRAVKKFRMGNLVDSVKSAAEGVKTHGSSVASWVRNSVSPSLRTMLPPSPPPTIHSAEPTAPASPPESTETSPCSPSETFGDSNTLTEWKVTSNTDSLRIEKSVTISKVCRRQACMVLPTREAPKTNGHSLSLPPPASIPKPCPSPRLGRPLNLRLHRSPSVSTSPASSRGNASYTSMYEKTFPIHTGSPSCGSPRQPVPARPRCTAQESVREEEKEVYRQLLTMVSGGQSSLFHNGSSHGGLRSQRDFTSFLMCRRRLLQRGSSAGSESLEPYSVSAPPSPRPASSQASSPGAVDGKAWSPEPELPPTAKGPAALQSAPSPAALQDTSSQDTQSSVHDGDSVIFVKVKQGKRPENSSVPCFKAELWIKELTSLYDSRARERRRLIDEQEALASQLLRQRLSEEGQTGVTTFELQVRVPLEKEVPLAPIITEPTPAVVESEFPVLTEEMEGDVSRALRGGNQDEVLSEGFRLTITRKDLQTLSHLNWLNDEVINFYMNLLVERSKRPDLPSAYTFNTFFFPKLRSAGFSAVRRWTKKVDLFSHDILLVPVHLGVHWCLSVVDFRKRVVLYFDSMGGNDDEACRILLKYLKQESEDKRGRHLDTSDWTLHSKKTNEIPQQMNGSDCGMFTCKYAEYITKDRPITFTQKHMPYFRRRMVWEILNRKLL
ncbi:sentrin-specific protease 1 [Clupea harengus]|uniref:Sentrin-specific protease 1 n=1 Tax=Clupea harengus TaxID=7950 RepID=A0A6P3WFJ2_CLUHA|nr:sentrin-specific protease 1 [Clupea harengus]